MSQSAEHLEQQRELLRKRRGIGNPNLSQEQMVGLGRMTEAILTEEFNRLFSKPFAYSKFIKFLRHSLEGEEKRKSSLLRLAATSVKNYSSLMFSRSIPFLRERGWEGEILFAGLFDADLGIQDSMTALLLAEDHLGGWDSTNITDALSHISPGPAKPQTIAEHTDTYGYFAGRAKRYSMLLCADKTSTLLFQEYRSEITKIPFRFYPEEIKECILAGVDVAENGFRRLMLESS